jgi:hypothetical protein
MMMETMTASAALLAGFRVMSIFPRKSPGSAM